MMAQITEAYISVAWLSMTELVSFYNDMNNFGFHFTVLYTYFFSFYNDINSFFLHYLKKIMGVHDDCYVSLSIM